MDIFDLVKSLGADDYVSPTIPFIIPNGPVTPTPSVVALPSISLETATVSMKKGERAKIKVIINTVNQEIKSFSFKITFNKTYFRVIDSDNSKSGIQIPYTNSFFSATENNVDANSGVISFKAEAASGSASITSRIISEFEVEAIADGIGEFKVDKAYSSLTNNNNLNILEQVNSITLTVSGNSTTNSVTPTTTATVIISTVKPSIPGGGSITPKTALNDDLMGWGSVVFGTFLIISGIYIYKKKREYDIQR